MSRSGADIRRAIVGQNVGVTIPMAIICLSDVLPSSDTGGKSIE
jgi:hypothetical protein